jgi:glucose/arabinose dehydrogenase
MRRPVPILTLALLLAACGPRPSEGAQPPAKAAAAQTPASAETEPPNVPSQRPAFPGQTRAPALTTNTRFQVQTIARGLDHPWSLAFLPDGRALITERPGRLRIMTRAGALSAPVAGVPPVVTGEQSGLFEVARDRSGLVYLSYMEARGGGRSGLTVARAKLVESGGRAQLQNLQVIFRAEPPLFGSANLGGRLVFAPDGTLFVTVGDRFSPQNRARAQTLDNDIGKIVHINPDGSVPKDNPFVGRAGAKGEIWSIGHRNPEAAAINPWTHQLWIVEHGARGGDEINIIEPGRNYGWPVITYGEDYSGAPIGRGITQHAGMEQPIYYWDPVLAPSGMAFYDAALFPAWKGSLFVGGLAATHLARLTLKGDRVVGEEWLLQDLGQRIRDVRVGPDGALWLLTDETDGRVLRLAPK